MFKLFLHLAKFVPILIILASFSFGLMFFNIKGLIFAGLALLCNIINLILKNYFFKPIYYYMQRRSLPVLGLGERPVNHPRLDMLENYYSEAVSFGMPSGHSQSILFFATFWIMYILFEFKDKKSNTDIIYKCSSIIYLMILSIVVMYNRYYFRYHTIEQIMVGAVIGIGLGVLAFYLCRCIFLTNFSRKSKKGKKSKNRKMKKNSQTDSDEEEDEIEVVDVKQLNNNMHHNNTRQNDIGNVQQGTVIDSISNRKAQHQGEVERSMQRMSYDFHNEQVNDYINNYDNNGHYKAPQFTKINKVGYNEDLSNTENQRFSDNISFNNYSY